MIVQDLFEAPQLCPECGGVSFSDLILAEKKDACYYKVKASAKVWPSAYASGRLVQCRKKGADNYGKSKNEGVAEGKMAELEMDLEDPEITDRQFEKMYGMTRKEAREQFSQTDMWAFPEIRDPNRPLHERGVAEGLDPVKKRRLYDLIELYRDATDPSDYYDRDIEDPDEVIAMIRSEFGDKIAGQVAAGAHKMHYPRHDIQRSDPLGWKKPVDRITKAGKMYKQDSDYIKNTIRSRYKLSGKSATEGVAEGYDDEDEGNPVMNAIISRIMRTRPDLLDYDMHKLQAAIRDVALDVGDVDEIGSSDISGWVKRVEQNLSGAGVTEAINPDITNPAFSHQQQIGDYLYVARYWGRRKNPIGLKISAYHGNKLIGRADLMYHSAPFDDFADPETTPNRIWLESEITEVNPKYQRQGIMSTMYAYARMLGNTVKPSQTRSDDAKAAWASWRQSGDKEHLTKMRAEGVAEGYQLDEGAMETISTLVKKLPGIGKYYQIAQQYKPQLVQILKTSKSGKEVKQKMEALLAQTSTPVAEAGWMKQLGGLAVGGGSILSTMWMNAMGMIDGVLAHAAAGEVGGAVASGSILGLIPVTLMLFAAMLLFKGSKQSSDEKAQAFQAQRGQQGVAEGSGPKEKQKTPYRDINSAEYRAAAEKQKQQMAKDKLAEPGKKLLAKKGVAEGSGDKVHLKTPKHGLADHPGRNTGVGLRTFSQTPEQDRCPKCNSLFKNHYKQGVAEGPDEKIAGRYDPDEFDAMVQRLKKLAGAGPMKTVYDPQRRVYRNVPVAQQPDKK